MSVLDNKDGLFKALASLLATGLRRWHELQLRNAQVLTPQPLEVPSETVLSVVTPVNVAGESESPEEWI